MMHGLWKGIGWYEILTAPITLLPAAIILGAPQIIMLVLTVKSSTVVLKAVFVGLSALMVGAYGLFLAGVDLASSSTASVALVFVAFYLAVGAAAIGGLLIWLERKGEH
ncbi:hypothetical protein SAMN06295912_11022 [Sphingomonas laterariae]|uniref:Uncharacterized protein n=2 Tax=Edaphosphingomonas laterariae TaxID=861865 RepID=A0A239FUM9_9SPHN|nr:hypothetical protein SAMN06295912_11022 [Sphingomonas laterariae]